MAKQLGGISIRRKSRPKLPKNPRKLFARIFNTIDASAKTPQGRKLRRKVKKIIRMYQTESWLYKNAPTSSESRDWLQYFFDNINKSQTGLEAVVSKLKIIDNKDHVDYTIANAALHSPSSLEPIQIKRLVDAIQVISQLKIIVEQSKSHIVQTDQKGRDPDYPLLKLIDEAKNLYPKNIKAHEDSFRVTKEFTRYIDAYFRLAGLDFSEQTVEKRLARLFA
ncbi:hypothetical protein ACFL17_10375 [Pseudomonadota bacterium]